MPLTELEIRSANATDKPIKLFDGGGLYLLINPNGNRWWRLKYRYQGKERGGSRAREIHGRIYAILAMHLHAGVFDRGYFEHLHPR